MDPLFFATPAEFRRWLASNHAKADELWVGFHKRDSGEPSITWPEAVDEALCVGWIDGIRKRIDEKSYKIRFTPRKPGSTWSNVNTKRAGELIADGRMKPAGSRAFEARQEKKAGIYSFEQKEAPALAPSQEKRFRAMKKAWKFFSSQPPGYQRIALWWVISAKREETREKRLSTLIADSAAGLRIAQLRRE
jgi:uncharacterized protein YdeI (YjbR/CyaY-like superfamily)